jgi:hypothetical protein
MQYDKVLDMFDIFVIFAGIYEFFWAKLETSGECLA